MWITCKDRPRIICEKTPLHANKPQENKPSPCSFLWHTPHLHPPKALTSSMARATHKRTCRSSHCHQTHTLLKTPLTQVEVQDAPGGGGLVCLRHDGGRCLWRERLRTARQTPCLARLCGGRGSWKSMSQLEAGFTNQETSKPHRFGLEDRRKGISVS